MADVAELSELLTAGKFFWIDIVDDDEVARAAVLNNLPLDPSDLAWAKRFEQSGRMVIGGKGCVRRPGSLSDLAVS